MADYTYMVQFVDEDGNIVAEENHSARAASYQEAGEYVALWAETQLEEFGADYFNIV